jgi:hypothetical protein
MDGISAGLTHATTSPWADVATGRNRSSARGSARFLLRFQQSERTHDPGGRRPAPTSFSVAWKTPPRGAFRMDFRITGLPLAHFASLQCLDEDALRAHGVTRVVADAPNAYPCRITLEDAVPGEELLLLSYAHQPARTPYASAGPIFIRRTAVATRTVINSVPEQQRRRLLSVRAYDHHDWMVDAEVTEGTDLKSLIDRFLADTQVSYLHVHNARRGCYACRVDRA